MRVGVLGSRGIIAETYQKLLQDHPWFKLTYLGPPSLENEVTRCQILFSALPDDEAALWEPRLAEAGCLLISSSRAHRWHVDVPLLIPEVNREHLLWLDRQPWKGGIIAKPNCSLQSFVLALTPLRAFGIEKLTVTTLQSVSGAGYSGLPALAIQDNVIPFIDGEEEKTEREPCKIWGEEVAISSHCHRVPVSEGHLAAVSVQFKTPPSKQEILDAWEAFAPLPLPSSPPHLITYEDAPDRPQPRLDRSNAMGITVGRLRPCHTHHWRFVALAHNTVRGGAGGGLLTAETLSMPHGPKKSPFYAAEKQLSVR